MGAWPPFFCLLAVFLPGRAFAECSPLYDRIRQEALSWEGTRLTCDDVGHVDDLLSLGSRSAGEWGFEGEQVLREDLRARYDVYIPTGTLPIGFVERQIPVGGRRMLLVFGLGIPKRIKAVLALVDAPDKSSRGSLAARLGNGAFYDRVGFYPESGGRYPKEGRWLAFGGGAWGKHQPIPEAMRLCLPCSGWLCPEEPLACFSGFGSDSSEEIHLTDQCDDGCKLLIVEPDLQGGLRVLFKGPGSGE